MADESLSAFLTTAKGHGISDETLVGMLRQNGWSERRIYRALSEHYASVLGVAVPSRAQTAESARDAFLYLLNFITLGFWTVALWQIWNDLVERWFPDAFSTQVGTLREDIAWQVGFIVVAFPIFAIVHSLIGKELARRPELYYSAVRRWLTYVALILAAIAVVFDAAFTIHAWIVGQLTTRFLLDAIGLIVLGGGVFTYYLVTMDPPQTRR
ncbi:MAG: DUF5671 domain-containing protein [Candidatus Cybelea sp.]